MFRATAPTRPRRRLCPLVPALFAASAALLPGAGCQPGPEYTAVLSEPVERSALRERAIDTLLAGAYAESAELRTNALEGLLLAPSRATDALRAGLSDTNPAVRSVAAMGVGRLALPGLAGAIQPLTADPDPRVRAAAVYALSRCGAAADLSPLARMLQSERPRVRAQAAYVLGELGDASALEMLRESASNDLPTAKLGEWLMLRLQLAEAMAKLGDTDAIEFIRSRLYPSKPGELEAAALAAQILGEIQDHQAAGGLIYLSALRDGAAEVRLAAAWSLAQLDLSEGGVIADEYAQHELFPLRAQAAHVYGRTGKVQHAPKLAMMLDDPSPLVRIAAAAALLRLL